MISVVIPTYNRAGLIRQAVESVLVQEKEELEVIIVDDGSTDDTVNIIREIDDDRIRLICLEKNSGACHARNVGIQAAKGEYIAFQDSDDVWYPGKLHKQMKYLLKENADIVFCAFNRVDTQSGRSFAFPTTEICNPHWPVTQDVLLKKNLISTQTMLGRKECFERVPFSENFPRMQDWDLVLRLSHRYCIRFQNEVMVDTRIQPDSLSMNPKAGLMAFRMLEEKYHNVLRTLPPARNRFARHMAEYAVMCGEKVSTCGIRALLSDLSPKERRAMHRAIFRGLTKGFLKRILPHRYRCLGKMSEGYKKTESRH